MIPDSPVWQQLQHLAAVEDPDLDLAALAAVMAEAVVTGSYPPWRDTYTLLNAAVREQHADLTGHVELTLVQKQRQALCAALAEYRVETQAATGQEMTFPITLMGKKGPEAVLAFLYVLLGRAQGWDVVGIAFPGMVLVRLESEGERLILHPGEEGREMKAADLRHLLKKSVGPWAELSHAYLEPLSSRALLICVQNVLKSRLIASGEYIRALMAVTTIEIIDPHEYRVLFDRAILYVKLGQKDKAVEVLHTYLQRAEDPQARRDAQALLQTLMR